MVKEMRFESSNPFSLSSSFHKHNHVFVKFAVSFLLVGLAFRLLFSDSIRLISVVEPLPAPIETEETESPVSSFPVQSPPPLDSPANNTTQKPENRKQISFLCFH